MPSKHDVGFWCWRRPGRPSVLWEGLERICGLWPRKSESVDGGAKESGSVEQMEAHGERIARVVHSTQKKVK